MYLLRAFPVVFVALFIALPIIGFNLGKKNKLGSLLGSLAGMVIVVFLLIFLPFNREPYYAIFYILMAFFGMEVGRVKEFRAGKKIGAFWGAVIGALIGVFIARFSPGSMVIVWAWLAIIILAARLGKRLNALGKINLGPRKGVLLGIVMDFLIFLFVFAGFSAQ